MLNFFLHEEVIKLKGFKIYENPPYEPTNNSSPKISLPKEDIFMQEDIFNTSLNDIPIWDEPLEDGVDHSLNMFLPHENTLEKEDDILVKEVEMTENSFDNTSPSIHLNSLPPRDEAVITYDTLFPIDFLNHKDTLEK